MTSETSRPNPQDAFDEPGSRLWTGMIGFASIMLVLIGGFHVLGGFIALLENRVYDADATDLLLFQSYAGWGIAHMALGTLALLTGVGLVMRKPWSRVATMVIASFSAVTNLAFLSASPGWYGLLIMLDVLVIYAVTVHFEDERE
ncbi:hypothetical protein [uncultured Nocardioides sp.]|uniref:DUF7144 family membrane protein n=1 Tax=uncultured Nocardioides sp. TaxID=198441 RepID=UPI002633A8DF|nr:hypothetical protein [uncultured Nocardioides sp.]